MDWDSLEIEALIATALTEDIGPGDVSVAATVSPNATAVARLIALENLVCAGLPLVERIVGRLHADILVELRTAEGQSVARDTTLLTVSGNLGAILSGEQTVLSFLSRLCGIATLTREYVRRVSGTRTRIRDTRITSPSLRQLEQHAIRVGGGVHHRAGLSDSIVLTRAHIIAAGASNPRWIRRTAIPRA